MGTLTAPRLQQAPEANALYERDFYSWTEQQAAALKRKDLAAIDWENVIEEIETLGRAEKSSLTSYYANAVEHLLKLQYRGPRQTDSVGVWRASTSNARDGIEKVLRENPGLKGRRGEIFAAAWMDGRRAAINAFVRYDTESIADYGQHRLAVKRARRRWNEALPRQCPYTRAQVEDVDWWPERAAPLPADTVFA